MAKPDKVKTHHLNKTSKQKDIDDAWADAATTAVNTPDTAVEIYFDAGNYRIPQIASGALTIVGDDLIAGPPGVIASVYTDTDSGKVVVEYTAYVPPPS